MKFNPDISVTSQRCVPTGFLTYLILKTEFSKFTPQKFYNNKAGELSW